MQPLADHRAALDRNETTSGALTAACLEAIASGEGARAFIEVYSDGATTAADVADRARAAGLAGPLGGLPISIKDLLDVAGEVTRAGSVVRADAAPAAADSPVVRRLRQAGAVLTGRTNMTEFAYSGLGLNPHYGTPANPYDRATGRIPGGSSAGAAVSVTDGMALAAIGSDTGGSVRIPAAFCGLTGLKPTARRVPTDGVFPLSYSLDSIGPLAPTVACCAAVDAVIADIPLRAPRPLPVAGLRLAVPDHIVLDDLDDTVAGVFDETLRKLAEAGARITTRPFPVLAKIGAANASGGFVAPECYAIVRELMEKNAAGFDPRVLSRIIKAEDMPAADYVTLQHERAAIIAEADAATAPFDAVIMPTMPMVAPAIQPLLDDDRLYAKNNMLALRNCSLGNFLDRCAITLPCHRRSEAPVGLMIMGETMGDQRLLDLAAGLEKVISHFD